MSNILLADDDPVVLEIFGSAFLRAGHRVSCVTDGREVLDALDAKQTDCLILDCVMPMVTGIEVIRKIRVSAKHCRLPVVMLTARSSSNDREVAVNSRVDVFCTKNCDPDWLVMQAEDLIERKAKVAPVMIDPWLERLGTRRFV